MPYVSEYKDKYHKYFLNFADLMKLNCFNKT